MSKTVFFDIDGTIWDDDMVIPESTIEAVATLKENGHLAFICTAVSYTHLTLPTNREV